MQLLLCILFFLRHISVNSRFSFQTFPLKTTLSSAAIRQYLSAHYVTQRTLLYDSRFPVNAPPCNSTPVLPHTHTHTFPTCGIYLLCSNSNSVHCTGITVCRVAVSELQWRDFPENLCFGYSEHSEYPK